MQRQKTIAKWLAIILLLTSVIACYIAFSSIIKDKKSSAPDIAGANTDNSGEEPTTNPDVTAPEPVYSVFPRSPETVDGVSVAHVGGEDNDVLLDTLYYLGKRFVIFYSASLEYDVKDCGIHIATFENGDLISANKIGEADESFVTASIVENGLLVMTKNSAQTKLRLLNGNLGLICQNVCPLYSDYKLYVTSAGVKLYTTDNNYIYANTISKSLDVTRSSYVHPIVDGEIKYTASLSSYDIIFAQTAQGIAYLTFSQNDGFKCAGEMLNCRLLQILPHLVNGTTAFALLAKCNDGIIIANIDATLGQSATYTFKGAKSAVALPADNDNICVIADGAKTIFCSHLDLQSTSAMTFSDSVGSADNITYKAIDGESEYILISRDSTHYLVKVDDDTMTAKFKCIGKSVTAVHDIIGGKVGLSLLFDGNINNNFAHMCFGGLDVFYIFNMA